MAGHAQKKAAQAASSTASFYSAFVLIVNAVYGLWLASQAFNGASPSASVSCGGRCLDPDHRSRSLPPGTERWAAYKAWSLTRKLLVWGGAAFCYWSVP